jgi:Protein of unknown function (DUF3570)
MTCAPARLTTREQGRGSRAWVVVLSLTLLRAARASGQEENQVGYRHELYQEDGNRMHIDTDSAHFDVGLGSRMRLYGDLVVDSISGATPNGAPPQAQWPFPKYQNLYQNAFNQAYAGLFNQYASDNQIYVDAGYETYQQMTNLAAAYANTSAAAIASNSATASYHTLTNNPHFRSRSVPLTRLHDHRDAFSLGAPISFGKHLLTPSFSYSEEHDYISYGGALNYAWSLNEKNTTLNLGIAHNSDSVRDDKFFWESKDSEDFLLGVVQLLSPKSYLTFNFTYGNESGYLSDPYRGVMARTNFPQANPDDPALIPEKRPRHRGKEVVYLSWTQFIDPLDGSFDAGYRFFHDSAGIAAHTFDLAWHQKIGSRLVVSPSFRYYLQSAADYYYDLVPDYTRLPNYYSSDYRLSHLQSFAWGLSVTCRIHRSVSLDASYMRYVMEGLDGVTSQSAYPAANVVSAGLRIWF